MKKVEDRVRLPPNMFGSKLEEALLRLLREKYERRMYRELGLVLSCDDVKVEGDGVVIPGDGGAYYQIRFDMLTFMPHVNEVYAGEVKEVVEFGGFVSLGPIQGLLHVSQISREKFFYDKKNKGLTSRIEKRSLKKGDALLFKASTVSMKATTTDTKIGLTMRPEGLGKVEWLEEREKKAKGKKEKEDKAEKKGEKAEKKEEKNGEKKEQ